MLRELIGAQIGRRIAGRHSGVKGALIGAAIPWLARRALGPAGLVLLGAYGAKKLYDRRRNRSPAPAATPPPAGVEASA